MVFFIDATDLKFKPNIWFKSKTKSKYFRQVTLLMQKITNLRYNSEINNQIIACKCRRETVADGHVQSSEDCACPCRYCQGFGRGVLGAVLFLRSFFSDL